MEEYNHEKTPHLKLKNIINHKKGNNKFNLSLADIRLLLTNTYLNSEGYFCFVPTSVIGKTFVICPY